MDISRELKDVYHTFLFWYYKHLNTEQIKKKLKKMYRKNVGHELNIDNPKSFTEKMQWSKIYDVSPIKTQLCDKYAVRDWVEKVGGGNVKLIPLLGVWDSIDDIDFNELPSRFVLKTNHASGTNIFVTDKDKLDVDAASKKMKRWLNTPFYLMNGFEMQYKNVHPKIIAEQDMTPENDGNTLNDYKFFCFDGKCVCSYATVDYDAENHAKSKLGFFDRDWNLLPFGRTDFNRLTEPLEKPKHYDEMVNIAETLSKGFRHVRVDLYNIKGQIYFGEMTFTTGGGFFKLDPPEWDRWLGEFWNID